MKIINFTNEQLDKHINDLEQNPKTQTNNILKSDLIICKNVREQRKLGLHKNDFGIALRGLLL